MENVSVSNKQVKVKAKKVKAEKVKKPGKFKKNFKKYFGFYLLLLLPVVFLIVFKYAPMFGNVLAFRRWSAKAPFLGSEWVGLYYFKTFLGSPDFWIKFKNTLILSFTSLLFTFPLPIVFALLLNEIKALKFKKVVQTASYLPHFISTVVAVGMIMQLLTPNGGAINSLRVAMGMDPHNFMQDPAWFRPIYIISELWQHVGWNAIVFIAALAGVDQELYEAAMIDGANRFQQTLHITIPGIAPAVIISLIITVGSILTIGTEKILLMQNPLNLDTSDVVGTYVYRLSLGGASAPQYSLSTAIGLFDSVIGLLLVGTANFISNKLTDTALW